VKLLTTNMVSAMVFLPVYFDERPSELVDRKTSES
jgi:hypothetical protein